MIYYFKTNPQTICERKAAKGKDSYNKFCKNIFFLNKNGVIQTIKKTNENI